MTQSYAITTMGAHHITINMNESHNYYRPLIFSMSKSLYSEFEQNTRALLNGLQKQGGPPIYTLSPEKAREVLSTLQASIPVQKLPADIENRTIPEGPDGKDVSITIVRPTNSGHEILSVVIYIHGGGWVLGGFDTHERLVREIANKANVAIVFVNYTPSPEAKYPIALEQAYTATKWVAQNGKSINVDPSRMAVVGDSVGGNLTAALTLLAKERGIPQLDSKCFSIQLLMPALIHHRT
jgi:acetyl esterase